MSSKKSKTKSSSNKAKPATVANEVIKVRKPKAILFDMNATVSKTNFIDDVMIGYIKANVKVYIENNWNKKVTQEDVQLLRQESKKDGPVILDSGDEKTIQQSVCAYVLACVAQTQDNRAFGIFRFHMLFDGYKRGKLKTAVYSDVALQITNWNNDGINLYLFSNGWKTLTERMMSCTNHGNLGTLIKGYFDNQDGSLTDKATYQKIAQKPIAQKPEDILFLTKVGDEARAAIEAKIEVILVLTHDRDVEKRSDKDKLLPYIRTFNELNFTADGKRPSELNGASNKTEKTSGKTAPKSASSKSKSINSKSKSLKAKPASRTQNMSNSNATKFPSKSSSTNNSGKSSTDAKSSSLKSSSSKGSSAATSSKSCKDSKTSSGASSGGGSSATGSGASGASSGRGSSAAGSGASGASSGRGSSAAGSGASSSRGSSTAGSGASGASSSRVSSAAGSGASSGGGSSAANSGASGASSGGGSSAANSGTSGASSSRGSSAASSGASGSSSAAGSDATGSES